MKLHDLSLIFISKITHSASNQYFEFLMEDKFCSKYKHLVSYSRIDLPNIDYNLEFANYHHHVPS